MPESIIASQILLTIIILLFPALAHAGLTTVEPFAGTHGGGLIDGIIAIINALLVLAAIAAIAFIIIGGVRYITAQGDEDALLLAKNTVIYAIIGIIVIILAAVIVNYFKAQI